MIIRFLRYLPNLSESGYSFERALIPRLKAAVREMREENPIVMDYGCGLKPYASIFKDFPGLYFGIDLYKGKRVDVVFDGYRMPVPSHSIDLIFSTSVLEYVEHLPLALSEMGRVLKPGGRVIWVVPFMSHTHGAPFDFHRPTRFGWEALVLKIFPNHEYEIIPVDGRFNCVCNIITSQLNYVLYDLMRVVYRNMLRKGHRRASKTIEAKNIQKGTASPESASSGTRMAYFIAYLNPINFLLGFSAWILSFIPVERRAEGEICSGFLVQVVSPKA